MGVIRDDDPMVSLQLPYYPSLTGFVTGVYRAAYLEVETLGKGLNRNTEFSFNLNLTDLELQLGIDYDNAQDVYSTNAYWASLLAIAYQPDTNVDSDPDFIDGPNNNIYPSARLTTDQYFGYGDTVQDSDNASVVYLEVHRDLGNYDQQDLLHTIAHEIGHAGGGVSNDADHAEGGIMNKGATNYNNSFSDKTLKRFRSQKKW